MARDTDGSQARVGVDISTPRLTGLGEDRFGRVATRRACSQRQVLLSSLVDPAGRGKPLAAGSQGDFAQRTVSRASSALGPLVSVLGAVVEAAEVEVGDVRAVDDRGS